MKPKERQQCHFEVLSTLRRVGKDAAKAGGPTSPMTPFMTTLDQRVVVKEVVVALVISVITVIKGLPLERERDKTIDPLTFENSSSARNQKEVYFYGLCCIMNEVDDGPWQLLGYDNNAIDCSTDPGCSMCYYYYHHSGE